MTETQERFLKVIAARIPPERVVELHLFPSLRQGAIESGVAVIAAEPEEQGGGGRSEVGAPGSDGEPDTAAGAPVDDTAGDAPPTDDGAGGIAARPEALHPDRLTIYTARYRLTIKGPDRGKWEATVAVEADAPLVTLEAVVRGVRHRAGDGAETERLSGEELRAALAAPAW